MIRYKGTKNSDDGSVLYSFVINGLHKEICEGALKQHPDCYVALPATAKAGMNANRHWLSRA